jgi:hypothetical protein
LSWVFLAVISAAGTVLEIGNLATEAHDPKIAVDAINITKIKVFIFCLFLFFPTLVVFRSSPLLVCVVIFTRIFLLDSPKVYFEDLE